MSWKIQVKNYRCFADSNPLIINLSNPVTALVGPNNSGKTAALRFFWEMGRVLSQAPNALMGQDTQNGAQAIFPANFRSLSSQDAVFTELNDRPIEVDLWQLTNEFPREPFGSVMDDVEPAHIRMRIHRNSNHAEVFLVHKGEEFVVHPGEFEKRSDSLGNLYTQRAQQYHYYIFHVDVLDGLLNPTFIPAVRPFGNIQIPVSYDLKFGQSVISNWIAYK